MAFCQWWERSGLRLRVSEVAVDRLHATCTNAYGELLAPRTVIASASGWFEVFGLPTPAVPPTVTQTRSITLPPTPGMPGVCVDVYAGGRTSCMHDPLTYSNAFQLIYLNTRDSLALSHSNLLIASNNASAPTSKPSSARTGPIIGGIAGVLGTIVVLEKFGSVQVWGVRFGVQRRSNAEPDAFFLWGTRKVRRWINNAETFLPSR
ncbi:hypothetical protein GGX14DRAFT_595161 [Mycena pura]|uniref:Uncharacterized protein n=1 Tax=Mycena pura TaxID=153505 RepID=A0AAD6VVZ6_9AGAR|nr:hypothetical protein GGX14DRAFT_595161 [Mycena pura]